MRRAIDARHGGDHARARHSATSQAEAAQRAKRVDRGRRVRPRGDGPHPRGQARRALDQAGDCHRPLQGPQSRRAAQAPHRRPDLAAYPRLGHSRLRGRAGEAEAAIAITEAQPRHPARDEGRETKRRVALLAVSPGQDLSPHASWDGSLASGRGETRRRHSQAHGHHARSSSEGGPHAPPARFVAFCAGLQRLALSPRRLPAVKRDDHGSPAGNGARPGHVISADLELTRERCDQRR